MRKAFSLSITLWISAALMAGAIYFLNVNKQNLKIASSLQDKLLTSIELDSTMELLKYYIALGKISKNRILNNNQNILPISLPIDGSKFKYMNSLISIQDIDGLLNTMYSQDILSAIKILNIKKYKIAKDSLNDWLDTDKFHNRNGAEARYYERNHKIYKPRNNEYIYHYNELDNIRGFKDINLTNLVHTPKYGLNCYTMSELTLRVRYGISKSDAKLLVSVRKNSLKKFKKLFDKVDKKINDPLISLISHSKTLKINITTKINNATTSTTLLIDFRSNINLYLD